MKKIHMFVKAVACTVAMVTLANAPVFPISNINTKIVQAVSNTISGTLNLTRYPSGERRLGTVSLNNTSKIILNMPNNNKRDLMQGKIRLVPTGSGQTKSYEFMNSYNENWTIELSDISSGVYTVYLNPVVYGMSDKATFNYTIGGGSTDGSGYFTGICTDPLELNVAKTDISSPSDSYAVEPDDFEPNDTIEQAYPYASMPYMDGNKFIEGYKSVGTHEDGNPDFFKIRLNSSTTYDVNLKNLYSEQHIYILQKNSDGTFTYWGQKNQVPKQSEYFTFRPATSGEYYILITGGSKQFFHQFFAVEPRGKIDPFYEP